VKQFLFCLSLVLLNLFFYRWTLHYNFKPDYWENYYYESQWNIPNSSRQIGDDGVYRYIGYRLVNGENPFNVDYWVPPFGKYLYGLTAKYLLNPYLSSIFIYFILTFVYFKLSSLFFSGKKLFFAQLLFHLNPFIVGEIGTTMLDLPLTLILTTSLWLFLKYTRTSDLKLFLLSFFLIGLAICTKPPFFVFSFVLVFLIYLLHHQKYNLIFLSPILVAVGYVAGYFPTYFIYHPNPIPFIRLHQKIYEFQKNNLGSHNWQSVITYILYGRFMGYWVNAKPIYPTDYSLLFPVGAITSIYTTIRTRPKNPSILLISMIAIVYIFQLFLVDFWPRYVMPIIPIFTILICHYTTKKFFGYLVIPPVLISILLSYFQTVVFPSQQKFIEQFKNYQSTNRTKEMYELLDSKSQKTTNFNSFTNQPPTVFSPLLENNQWRMSLTNKPNIR
jgi:hypothetical protein